MRIGARLALGFGAVVTIMLALSFAGIWLGKKSRDDLAAVVATTNAKQVLAAEM
jgi:CHASE3 domain sensor protein